MKMCIKAAFVAAALTASIGAFASEETKTSFYGLIDAGALRADGLGSAGNQHAFQIQSGIVTTSHFGVFSKTSLGDGHSVGFKLEGNIALNDGGQVNLGNNGASNVLFSREASMSYGNQLGTLTFGRQKTPFAQSFAVGDAREWANIGTANILFGDMSSFGGSATLKTGLGNLNGGTFTSNLLKYDSPTWYGASATVYYAPGGYAGNTDTGSSYGTNIKYVLNNLTVAAGTRAAYDKTATAPKIAQASSLSGMYTLGAWKFGAGVATMENPSVAAGTANSSFRITELTTAYKMNARTTLSIGSYGLSDRVSSANGTTITGAGATYDLSKSTKLYAQYANSNNKGTTGIAAYGYGYADINSLAANQATFPSVISMAGVNQTALAFGIQHRF